MKRSSKLLSAFLLVLATHFYIAQNETKKWYFGGQAGLDFVPASPAILTNGQMSPWEGCASIADNNGALLFYTDGITVWNKLHAIMANGNGLFGNSSTTQTGVIVKQPGSTNMYFVFTADAQAAANGLRYSTVDMSLAAGNGSVVAKNVPLQTPTCEKITAVRHCNGVDVWVITHDWLSNNFRCFLVTSSGISAPVNTAIGTVHNGSNANTIGQMKASPNGRKLALAIHDAPFNAFEIFDFNNSTGVVSNPFTLGNSFNWAYGVEFSPDGTKLYGGKYGGSSYQIYQWNICAGSNAAILASQFVVATTPVMIFAFQLASNGKIYVCRYQQQIDGVINTPNALGAGCGYVDLGQSTAPKVNNLGLPNFITSFFKTPPPPFTYTVNSAVSCLTASFTSPPTPTVPCASSGYSVSNMVWNFGDPLSGPLNTSTVTNPSHSYPGPGTYTAQLILNYTCGADTIKVPVSIVSPSISITTTSATCSTPGSATVVTTNGTGPYTYTWSPSAQTTSIATNLSPGIYTVTVLDNGGGCSVTGTTNLGSQSLMSGTVTPSPVSCNGGTNGSATLAIGGGSGNYSYSWTPSAQTNSVATNLAAGIYTITANDLNNSCSVTKTVQITQPMALTLTAVANTPSACVGNNIQLTANATGGTGSSYTYTWSPSVFSATNTVIQSTGGTYIYTVTGTDVNGCAVVNTISVNFINNPTLTTVSSTICAGNTATLSASGATSYVWNPGSLTGGTITLSPAANTTLTVTGSIGACTSTSIATVFVNALPTPTAQSNSPVCAGQPINLTGLGGTTYTWTGPVAFNSSSQNPVINSATASNGGTYSLSVTNLNGCISSATTNVVVNPLPTPTVSSNSPVCLGFNINLLAAGGSSYSWSGPSAFTSSVQNPTIANAAVSNGGIYTVTVTALTCTNTATVNVSIFTPTTTANNTGPYCAGATIQLSSPVAGSYTWTGPNSFSSNVQNPSIAASTTAMSGTYSLTTSVGSCAATAITNITVNALPTPTALNTGPYCAGASMQLNVNAASSYTWSGPGSFASNNQNPANANATTTNSGVYTVTVTDGNGCKNSSTTSVTVNSTPTVSASGSSVCVGQNMNLISSSVAGAAYAWSGPNGFTATSQNTTVTGAQANMTGIYVVTVTSPFSCTNIATANVSVTPLPTPNAVNSSPLCAGSALNFTVTGGSTYAWSGPNGFSSNNASPTLTNASLAANGEYTVIVTANTCSAIATTSVIVNALPVPTAANNGPICEATALNLTGTGGTGYSWTGPLNFNSALQNPSITNAFSNNAGVYILTVTDANGCQATASTTASVNANPVILANGATVCFGQPATLTATGGVTYSWTGPNNFSSTSQNVTIPVANNSTSGTYNVIVTAANSCASASAVNVGTYPLPVPTITSTAKTCVNTPVTLQGSPGFLLNQWTGPNNFLSPNAVTSFTPVSMTQSGIYVFSVTDNRGCVGSASTLVALNPLPDAKINIAGDKKCVPFCTDFTLQSDANSSPLVSASWLFNGQSFGGMGMNYCIKQAGNYSVKAFFTDANGCPGSTSFTLAAYPIPTAIFEFAPANPTEELDEVHFTDESKGEGNTWNWYFVNNNGYHTTVQNPNYIFDKAGSYPVALVVTNKWGCADTTIRIINVGEDNSFFVPNAFTPNGDGINDIFFPKGYGILKYDMTIFDRWGGQLFSTNDLTKGWDGTFKDVECKNDVYVWKINITLPNSKVKTYTGHVTLNR